MKCDRVGFGIMVLFFNLMIVMGTGFSSDKDSIGLSWQSFNAGLQLAQKQNRPVLVDFYTDWCGWCKKMDRDTYGNKDVTKFLSEKFVLVKLNPEENKQYQFKDQQVSGNQLARMFGVRGYPTTGFLDATGQPITAISGYIQPEKFLIILRYIQGKWYDKMEFKEFENKQIQQ